MISFMLIFPQTSKDTTKTNVMQKYFSESQINIDPR